MGFMDELRKLTQPYDDEDDFFEGADESFKSAQATAQAPQVSAEQTAFENNFAAPQGARVQSQPKPQPSKPFFQRQQQPQQTQPQQIQQQTQGEQSESLFGNLGKPRQQRPQRSVNFGGREAQVVLFSPKTFDEAGEIVNHINANHSVVMTLEGIPTETARRLLDFISGIAFALQGKITPVSAKTYFVTPQNVDIIGAQGDTPESDGQYF